MTLDDATRPSDRGFASDRLLTDVAMPRVLVMSSVRVLTGVTTLGDAARRAVRTNVVIRSLLDHLRARLDRR